jgi:hypothetical protein
MSKKIFYKSIQKYHNLFYANFQKQIQKRIVFTENPADTVTEKEIYIHFIETDQVTVNECCVSITIKANSNFYTY